MYRRYRCLLLSLLAVLPWSCGGNNPAGPSGAGVKLQGVVLQGSSGASAQSNSVFASSNIVSAQSAGSRITVTVVENASLSTTVSGNGTFELDGVPTTGFTLSFSVNGVTLGTISISAVDGTATIKIVVQVTSNTVQLVNIETENETQTQTQNQDQNSAKTCMIEGGRAGEHIELEGVVASGNSDHFLLQVNGNRSRGPVDVFASGASFQCHGDKTSSTTCKASVKGGAQVHVRGTLTLCNTSKATVTATEVMVQKD